MACACNDVDVARLLLEKGASVNQTSNHSSPLIYASEYNNVDLMSLLLQHGADIHMVPEGLKTETAVLPLYQACLYGHKDIAELLLFDRNVQLLPEKKICLLGLLGAQCINKHQDFVSGVRYWQQALEELENCSLPQPSSEMDLGVLLQKLYIREAHEQLPFSVLGNDKKESVLAASSTRKHSVFKDMRLCTSMQELNKLKSDPSALSLQGLLVLESILGPSHSETTSQVSCAARQALENGDLGAACKLFLYIIESNENRNQTSTATEYTSQLADLLLNVFSNYPENLTQVDGFVDLLLAAAELVQEGMCKVYEEYSSGQAIQEPPIGYLDSQVKQHSKIRLLCEMVETFMAYLRMFIDQEVSEDQWRGMRRIVSGLLQASRKCVNSKFNIQCELLKICVYGGQSTLSTLYFFQELYPNVQILEFLLACGASVNCQDNRGDTPLHFSLDCQKPDPTIVQVLLESGAHIDTCNASGQTPYQLLAKLPTLRINPFHYMSLKCLAACAIMNFHVPYKGQIPRVLEHFVPLHGFSKSPKVKGLKKSASLEDIHVLGN